MRDMLIKMREQLNKKVEEAFAKFMETAADEDVKAYTNLTEQLAKVNDQIAALEAEDLKKQGKAAVVEEEKNQKYKKETRDWAKKVCEAIAVGSTYKDLVPTEIATGIVEKLNDYGRIAGRVTRHNRRRKCCSRRKIS